MMVTVTGSAVLVMILWMVVEGGRMMRVLVLVEVVVSRSYSRTVVVDVVVTVLSNKTKQNVS